MRVLILGSSGFIGSNLARHFSHKGCEVIAMCRSGYVENFTGESYPWQFGEDIPEVLMNRLDCVLHLAHDFNGVEGAELTLKETVSCIDKLYKAGVKRQIYFSSYSAGSHTTSVYGKTKLQIERAIYSNPTVIIARPGLVVGYGGIYGRIQKIAQKIPLIPLPSGGKGMVPVIAVERLSDEVFELSIMDMPPKEANLFECKLITLRQIVKGAARMVNRNPIIINIPSVFFRFFLWVAQILNLPLPIKLDNLEGFLSNQSASHKSTIR